MKKSIGMVFRTALCASTLAAFAGCAGGGVAGAPPVTTSAAQTISRQPQDSLGGIGGATISASITCPTPPGNTALSATRKPKDSLGGIGGATISTSLTCSTVPSDPTVTAAPSATPAASASPSASIGISAGTTRKPQDSLGGIGGALDRFIGLTATPTPTPAVSNSPSPARTPAPAGTPAPPSNWWLLP